MKQTVVLLLITLTLMLPSAIARADFWGGDLPLLAQILQNGITQLAQLKSILQSNQDALGLMNEINRGINDSLQMASTAGIRIDPGIYRQVSNIDQALKMVESVYGKTVDSKLATSQRNTDQTVAEAITFNNELNSYAQNVDRIGEEMKSYSHSASPGGAAKLTAEGIGVLIHVMNQQMRATGQGLKLQAQALALQNKKEKNQTEQYLKEGNLLKTKMAETNPEFKLPRF